jgi:hypothetical protein
VARFWDGKFMRASGWSKLCYDYHEHVAKELSMYSLLQEFNFTVTKLLHMYMVLDQKWKTICKHEHFVTFTPAILTFHHISDHKFITSYAPVFCQSLSILHQLWPSVSLYQFIKKSRLVMDEISGIAFCQWAQRLFLVHDPPFPQLPYFLKQKKWYGKTSW